MGKTTTEQHLSEQVVDRVARALAASEGYDWENGRSEVQVEWRRQARVAVGAVLEYMVEQDIRLVP